MRKGFTTVELFVIVMVLLAGGALFWSQKARADSSARDEERKVAINSIAYSLNHVYYKQRGYYPQSLNNQTFRVLDASILKDPNGVRIGNRNSDYRYQPTDCRKDKCQGYTLLTQLELEADYIKSSRSVN